MRYTNLCLLYFTGWRKKVILAAVSQKAARYFKISVAMCLTCWNLQWQLYYKFTAESGYGERILKIASGALIGYRYYYCNAVLNIAKVKG